MTDIPLVEDFLVYPTMVKLAGCLCEEMERSGFSNLCFCGIVPGAETVLDFCGDETGHSCNGEAGTCGGMAWVRLIGIAPSIDQENPAAGANCATPLAFQLEVGMSQCAPVLGEGGEVPGVDEQLDATRRQLASMSAMRRAIACCMSDDEVDYVLGQYEPLPIMGGCLASTWTLTVGEWRGAR
jgi:hypothetical protein